MKTDFKHLNDIIESINIILARFEAEEKIDQLHELSIDFDALVRRLLIVGQATKRLSVDFKEKYSDVEWSKLAVTRDVLVHDYDQLDLDIVRNIVRKDLPMLIDKLRAIRDQEEPEYYEYISA